MEIKTSYLKVEKTARYSTYGNLSSKTKYFWFALHGSNMFCEQMLYKFADFDPEEHFVVAPEGLNRFYLKGYGGDVVSSWMTSRDRLHEIEDFSNYLSELYLLWKNKIDKSCKKTILAFSQGGTSAFRWMHRKSIDVDHILAYSCWIPEDIDLKESKTDLQKVDIIYTIGRQDQYLTEDRMKGIQEIFKRNHLSPEEYLYDGDHRVDKKQLRLIFEKEIQ